jgi:regulator of CtrA degradation
MDPATSAHSNANPAFFSRTFDETMDLLVEARNYVAADTERSFTPRGPSEQLVVCCETFRLTSRLTHIMAWLLAQRAVHEGEITPEEAASEAYQLGGRTTCMATNDAADSVCDRRLARLLEQSLRLYKRVARLDDMVQNTFGLGNQQYAH